MARRFRLAALLAATAFVSPAHAEPITASIAAAASAVAAAGSIGGAIAGTATIGAWLINTGIALGASLGLGYLSSALAPKPKPGQALTGIETSVQMGGDVARQVAAGYCAVKGQLVFNNTFGAANESLDRVFALSDWPSEGLESVLINGKRYALQEVGRGDGSITYHCAEFAGVFGIVFYDGSQTAADPGLLGTSGGRWGSTAVLHGMTYVRVHFVFVKDHPLYDSGSIPDITFMLRGAKLYDWRKDGTAGGDGPHRWDDPATWSYSENNFVILYNYLRGFHAPSGDRLIGMGVPGFDLITETFTAAANICDEVVTKADGTTEPRYRCSTILTADEGVPHKGTIEAILSGCAGYLYDYGGSYVAQAGAAQSVVRTITDADLVVGQPVVFAAKRSRSDLVNRLQGQFFDAFGPEVGPQSYSAQVSAAGLAEDGEELGRQLDLMSVPSKSQGERVAQIRLREARAQKTAGFTLGIRHVDLRSGNWISFVSSRPKRSGTYRIAHREVSAATRAVRLELEETAITIYSWSSSNEGPPPATPIQLQPGTRISTVSGFAVAAGSVLSADGKAAVPALDFAWTPVVDGTVDAVRVQYRPVGSTAAAQETIDNTPSDGSHRATAGLVPGTPYEARATILTTPSRLTTWTAWKPVTTSASLYHEVALERLSQGLQDAIEIDLPAAQASADAAYGRAEALFREVDRSLSPYPEVRASTAGAGKAVQDAIDQIAEAVATISNRQELDRSHLYDAGFGPVAGGYGFRFFSEANDRLNAASLVINSLRAEVALVVSSLTGVDGGGLSAGVTTIIQRLNAIDGVLEGKASQTSLTDLGGVVTGATSTLSALGRAVQSTSAAQIALDVEALAEGLSTVLDQLDRLSTGTRQALAWTEQVASSRIDEAGRSIAETGKTVLAVKAAASAELTETRKALATDISASTDKANSALSEISTARGGKLNLKARIDEIEKTSVDQETGETSASAIKTLRGEVDLAAGKDGSGAQRKLTAAVFELKGYSLGTDGRSAVTVATGVETAINAAAGKDDAGNQRTLAQKFQAVVSASIDPITNKSALTIAQETAQEVRIAAGTDPSGSPRTLTARLKEVYDSQIDTVTGRSALTIATGVENALGDEGQPGTIFNRLKNVTDSLIDPVTKQSVLTIATDARAAIVAAKAEQPTLDARIRSVRGLAVKTNPDGTETSSVTLADDALVKANGISAFGSLGFYGFVGPGGYLAGWNMKVGSSVGPSAGMTIALDGYGDSFVNFDAGKFFVGGLNAFALTDNGTRLTIPYLKVTTELLAPNAVFNTDTVSVPVKSFGFPYGHNGQTPVLVPGSLSPVIVTPGKVAFLVFIDAAYATSAASGGGYLFLEAVRSSDNVPVYGKKILFQNNFSQNQQFVVATSIVSFALPTGSYRLRLAASQTADTALYLGSEGTQGDTSAKPSTYTYLAFLQGAAS